MVSFESVITKRKTSLRNKLLVLFGPAQMFKKNNLFKKMETLLDNPHFFAELEEVKRSGLTTDFATKWSTEPMPSQLFENKEFRDEMQIVKDIGLAQYAQDLINEHPDYPNQINFNPEIFNQLNPEISKVEVLQSLPVKMRVLLCAILYPHEFI